MKEVDETKNFINHTFVK